jgi:hypothetical protein
VNQYTQGLMNLVNLDQNVPINPVAIQELFNEIDLDFNQQDLPKTHKSMAVGNECIREID